MFSTFYILAILLCLQLSCCSVSWSNQDFASLEIAPAILIEPEFSDNFTDYIVTVPDETTSVHVLCRVHSAADGDMVFGTGVSCVDDGSIGFYDCTKQLDDDSAGLYEGSLAIRLGLKKQYSFTIKRTSVNTANIPGTDLSIPANSTDEAQIHDNQNQTGQEGSTSASSIEPASNPPAQNDPESTNNPSQPPELAPDWPSYPHFYPKISMTPQFSPEVSHYTVNIPSDAPIVRVSWVLPTTSSSEALADSWDCPKLGDGCTTHRINEIYNSPFILQVRKDRFHPSAANNYYFSFVLAEPASSTQDIPLPVFTDLSLDAVHVTAYSGTTTHIKTNEELQPATSFNYSVNFPEGNDNLMVTLTADPEKVSIRDSFAVMKWPEGTSEQIKIVSLQGAFARQDAADPNPNYFKYQLQVEGIVEISEEWKTPYHGDFFIQIVLFDKHHPNVYQIYSLTVCRNASAEAAHSHDEHEAEAAPVVITPVDSSTANDSPAISTQKQQSPVTSQRDDSDEGSKAFSQFGLMLLILLALMTCVACVLKLYYKRKAKIGFSAVPLSDPTIFTSNEATLKVHDPIYSIDDGESITLNDSGEDCVEIDMSRSGL
jgi:hypothetical protein